MCCSSSGGLLQITAPEDMPVYRQLETLQYPNRNDQVNMRSRELVIGTWNVRSLCKPGKLDNVLQEMSRIGIDILGLAETFWDGTGDFETTLLTNDEKFRVIYSGGEKRRRGVGFILRGATRAAVQFYHTVSDRIVCIRLKAQPVDVIVIQVYAPTNDAPQTETEEFYSELENVVKLQKKYQDCLVVMGDFNGKVGDMKEDNIVGPFGLGQRNENGQSVIDYCRKYNLMIANTWFETKERNRHTWIAPDKKTKNQIDYILIDNRYRNGVNNSKARPGADCDSDHNLVVAHLKIKLQRIVRQKQEKINRWNTDLLKEENNRQQFKDLAEEKLEGITDSLDINSLWLHVKTSLTEVAEEVCGKCIPEYRQQWMNAEILQKMELRRQYKKDVSEYGQKRYKDLKHEVQKLCRQAQNEYYNSKCEKNRKIRSYS